MAQVYTATQIARAALWALQKETDSDPLRVELITALQQILGDYGVATEQPESGRQVRDGEW